MKGISIIVPLYNKEHTITNCLEKIFAQTVKSFEVIVVDDGSTDKSVDMLKKFSDQITLITQPNQGPSAARNNGARISKYQYLSFVDADDEIMPKFVESHLSVREGNPEIELSINSFKVYVDNELKRTESLFSRISDDGNNQGCKVINEFNHLFCTNIHSSGFCINKSLFIEASGFDEELKCWEISDALMRFSLKAKKIAILNDFLSLVFEDENSLFKLENTNLEYKRKFCDKILKDIGKIPDTSKGRYFNEMEYLCYDYWKSFKLRDLLLFYLKVMEQPGSELYFSLPVKIKITVMLLKPFYSK